MLNRAIGNCKHIIMIIVGKLFSIVTTAPQVSGQAAVDSKSNTSTSSIQYGGYCHPCSQKGSNKLSIFGESFECKPSGDKYVTGCHQCSVRLRRKSAFDNILNRKNFTARNVDITYKGLHTSHYSLCPSNI